MGNCISKRILPDYPFVFQPIEWAPITFYNHLHTVKAIRPSILHTLSSTIGGKRSPLSTQSSFTVV